MRLEGWAADTQAQSSGRGVFLLLQNRTSRLVFRTRRVPRPDVAQFHHTPGYQDSGYVAVVWTEDVSDGCYRVSVRLLASAANGYYDLRTKWMCFWEE